MDFHIRHCLINDGYVPGYGCDLRVGDTFALEEDDSTIEFYEIFRIHYIPQENSIISVSMVVKNSTKDIDHMAIQTKQHCWIQQCKKSKEKMDMAELYGISKIDLIDRE